MAGSKSVAALLAASLATVALVSGCGADLNAHTTEMVPAIPGINVDSADHQLGVRDLLVSYNGPQGYPPGSVAPLLVRVFNDYPTAVTLTCVKVANAPGTVSVVGGTTPTPTTVPPVTATPTTTANGKKPSGSASPAPTNATPTSAAPTSAASASSTPAATPTPTGPAQAPACGGSFSVSLAPFGFALLVPEAGKYLVVSGLNRELKPGDPWLNLTFTFDNGTTTTTMTAERVPVGVPLSPLPRISGNRSEAG